MSSMIDKNNFSYLGWKNYGEFAKVKTISWIPTELGR